MMGGFPAASRTTIVALVVSLSALASSTQSPGSAADGTQSAATARAMSLVDLANLQRILGPQLSPDGKTLVYALSVTDWKLGRLVYHLWRQNTAGGAPVQLTFSEGGDIPVISWAPDG